MAPRGGIYCFRQASWASFSAEEETEKCEGASVGGSGSPMLCGRGPSRSTRLPHEAELERRDEAMHGRAWAEPRSTWQQATRLHLPLFGSPLSGNTEASWCTCKLY